MKILARKLYTAGKIAGAFFEKMRIANDVRKNGLVRLGTQYGGWYVPSTLFNWDRTAAGTLENNAIAVCVGAGEDISFDMELNARGMEVHILDPTPRARDHFLQLQQAAAERKSNWGVYDLNNADWDHLFFHAIGLWKEDATLKFYAPQNPDHVSHSVVNLQKTDSYFEAECQTLSTFMANNAIKLIDILKIDIEGAEYEVLKTLADVTYKPLCVLVEYDEGHAPQDVHYMDRINESVALMQSFGYKLLVRDGYNYCYQWRRA